MTNNEVLIVVALGFVGYLGTSFLIKFFKRESEWSSKQKASNSSHDQSQNDQPRPRNTNPTWYEILEVSPLATIDEIKSSYKRKILMYHPDKVSSLGPELNEIAQQKSKEINSAYDEAIRLKK